MRAALTFGLACLAFLTIATSCRDPAKLFEVRERGYEELDGAVRVTYSSGDDRAPAWSPAGDALYYHGAGFDPYPDGEGILYRMPGSGGAARLLLPARQDVRFPRRFATVSAHAAGQLAYAEISVRPASPCGGAFACPPAVSVAGERLEYAAVHVQPPGDSLPTASLTLDFEDTRPVFDPAILAWRVVVEPWQERFGEAGVQLFRPSWAPDGQRLAIADGRRLLDWTPATGALREVANTAGAVSAAWSPDGGWIAFTRLVPDAAATGTCVAIDAAGAQMCTLEKTVRRPAASTVTLVRPDGSETTELGAGEEPAWSPDGAFLYVVASGAIVRIAVADLSVTAVAGTAGGREPAVSPDGLRLAFTRRGAAGFDVWLVDLPR